MDASALVNVLIVGALSILIALSVGPRSPPMTGARRENEDGEKLELESEDTKNFRVRALRAKNAQIKEVIPARWIYLSADGKAHVDRLCPAFQRQHQLMKDQKVSKRSNSPVKIPNVNPTVNEMLGNDKQEKAEGPPAPAMSVYARWWKVQEAITYDSTTVTAYPYVVPCELCGRLYLAASSQ